MKHPVGCGVYETRFGLPIRVQVSTGSACAIDNKSKKNSVNSRSFLLFSRGGRIRTADLTDPNGAR